MMVAYDLAKSNSVRISEYDRGSESYRLQSVAAKVNSLKRCTERLERQQNLPCDCHDLENSVSDGSTRKNDYSGDKCS